MFNFTKNFWIPVGVGAGSLATGAGAAIGVILPKAFYAKDKALQAKKALQNWIPNGGLANSLKGKDKINYVALGDSETAGYNGLLGKDYLSYADFLAGSLKKASKLGTYSNLALSGERLSDFKKDIFQYPDKVRELHDADLITLTLGANDVLAYMKILNIPFHQALDFIGKPDKIKKISENIAKYDENENKFVLEKISDKKWARKIIMAVIKGGSNKDDNPELKVAISEAKKDNSISDKDINKVILKGKIIMAVIKGGSNKDDNPELKAAISEAEKDNSISDEDINKVINKTIAKSDIEELKPYFAHKASIEAAEKRKDFFGYNPNLGISKKDSAELFTGTIDKLSKILDDTPQALFNIDKDWYPKIFDLIKREYVTLIRDLHKAAPKAEIRVLGHAFPFSSFPQDVINKSKESMQGDSLNDAFEKMLSAIKEGAEKNLNGKSAFVKFQNINDFPTFKNKIKRLKPEVDLADINVFKSWVENNPMPNITDIHPSVYGHELIAEDLYEDVATEMGNISDIKGTTQHSNLVIKETTNKETTNPFWDKKDEMSLLDNDNLIKFYGSSSKIYGFATMGDMIKRQPTIFQIIIENLLKYMSEPSKDGSWENFGKISKHILPPSMLPQVIKLQKQNATQQASNAIQNSNQKSGGMFKLLSLKDNITNLVNNTKIITKQLEDEIKSKDWSNEDQWTLAQVGLAKLFKELFVISLALKPAR